MSRKLDREVVSGLSKSFKVLRPVYPLVKAEDGEILDGFHRKQAAPVTYERYCVTLKGVKSEKDKLLYRIHLNYRRKVTKDERKRQLTRLAEILEEEGVTREEMVSELAKITPFTARYIRELLPSKYKHEEMRRVAEISEEDRRWLAATVDTDGNIYLHKNGQPEIEVFNTNRDLVEKAAEVLKANVTAEKREGRKTLYKTRKHGAGAVIPILKQIEPYLIVKRDVAKEILGSAKESVPQTKVEVHEYKPKETWEHRKAVMSPPVSKMEELVLVKLAAKGRTPETQKAICIRYVRPDFYYETPRGPLAIFIDGPVHRGREDRDESLRQELVKRGVQVLSFPYESPSESLADAVADKILEALK